MTATGRAVPLRSEPHWCAPYALIAAGASAVMVLAVVATLGTNGDSTLLLLSGQMWILLFLLGFSGLQRWFEGIGESQFLIGVVSVGLVLRLLAIVIAYAQFDRLTGQPFEPYAVDSLWYHQTASAIATDLREGRLHASVLQLASRPSDAGYVLFLVLVYLPFGPQILFARIAQAVLGAFSARILYRFVQHIANDGVARTSAVLFATFPYLVYYGALHLKETLLIFLLLATLHQGTLLIDQSHRSAPRVLLFFVCLASLFLFRTFLPLLVVGGMAVHAFLARGPSHRIGLKMLGRAVAVAAGVGVLAVFVPSVGTEISSLIQRSSDQWQRELLDKEQRAGVVIHSGIASRVGFVAASVVGPLPSVVWVHGQDNNAIQYGFAWVRLSLLFFAGVGAIVIAHGRLTSFTSLVAVLAGYLVVIGLAGLPTSHRFQVPVMPLMLVMTSVGMHARWDHRRIFAWWCLFVVGSIAVVLYWNYLKVTLRG